MHGSWQGQHGVVNSDLCHNQLESLIEELRDTFRSRALKASNLNTGPWWASRNVSFWRIRGTMWARKMDCIPVVKWREAFKVLRRNHPRGLEGFKILDC